MQADLFDGVRHDPKAAPAGYFAVLKAEAKPKDGSNICRACDWRPECQKQTTDFTRQDHRCMPWARSDGSSVLFKRMDQFRGAAQMMPPNADVTGLPPAQTVELPPKPAGGRSELT